MAKNKPHKPGAGRPLEYNASYVKRANEYLDSCEDEEIQQLSGLSVKGTELYKNKLRVNIPSKGGLAFHLGVARETLYDWAEKYKEFSDIMERLGAIQESRLINNGLCGDYNPTIAKVLLTKHGYTERTELTGREGKDLIPDLASLEKAEEAINCFLNK